MGNQHVFPAIQRDGQYGTGILMQNRRKEEKINIGDQMNHYQDITCRRSIEHQCIL